MYKKLTDLAKLNEKLTDQVAQFDIDRNNLQKIVSDFEKKLKVSREKEAELTTELENIKKSVRMLNSGLSKLDETLAAGRPDKEHFGFGYTSSGKSDAAQTMFVKASTSGVKKDEDLKLNAPAVTPISSDGSRN